MVNGALITYVFNSVACFHGQVFAGRYFAVMVNNVIICLDVDIAAGNDVRIVCFFLNYAGMDGAFKIADGSIIIRRVKMGNFLRDIFVSNIPVRYKFIFSVYYIICRNVNIALAFNITGTVKHSIIGINGNIANGVNY